MWSPRERTEVVKLFGRRVALLGLLVCVAALGSAVWNIAHKARESAVLKRQAQAQLADLSERQQQLESNIARMQTDRGKEEALRQQYALAAEGEKLVVIIDQATHTPPVATSSSAAWYQDFFGWW